VERDRREGVAGNEADVIADFNRLAGDRFYVNAIDANETLAGDQAFTFIGTGAITGVGQISYFTTATDTYILLSTDAGTSQEMTIRVAGVHTVDASWFAL
jgi:serralysin